MDWKLNRVSLLMTRFLTSRRSQPPLALSVPLSRFTSRVGGGSAFYVRQHSCTSQNNENKNPIHHRSCYRRVHLTCGQRFRQSGTTNRESVLWRKRLLV